MRRPWRHFERATNPARRYHAISWDCSWTIASRRPPDNERLVSTRPPPAGENCQLVAALCATGSHCKIDRPVRRSGRLLEFGAGRPTHSSGGGASEDRSEEFLRRTCLVRQDG